MYTKRVLIVDGDENMRKIMRVAMNKANFDVVEATSREHAVQVMESDDNRIMVDVIIFDYGALGGVEMINQFGSKFPTIPLIIIGESNMQKSVESLRHKVMVTYLVKPLAMDKLTATINVVTDLRDLG